MVIEVHPLITIHSNKTYDNDTRFGSDNQKAKVVIWYFTSTKYTIGW